MLIIGNLFLGLLLSQRRQRRDRRRLKKPIFSP